jgi:hypothetical protein
MGRIVGRARSIGLAALALAGIITSLAAGPRDGPPAAAGEVARLTRLRMEAVEQVRQAARRDLAPAEIQKARENVGRILVEMGVEPGPPAAGAARDPLGPELRAELVRSAAPLLDPTPLLALLERVRVRLEGEVALGLGFEGSYSQTKAKERVYGGHASAMGPASTAPRPAPKAAADQGPPSPVQLAEGASLPARTYCGGPAKDHILESVGNGLALVDYDGDGRLDVYLVTAARLSPGRERIPHRNTLYRNLGDWRFEDVSAKAGVDAAAWGNGVCAGDADGDGRLDLYVTNWGPNFLFRNRGDGTFEETAAGAGVEAGGWSTGCAFFDAEGDGDLDLYVARYVRTSETELARAERTLVWRNGPRIMVGPAGLPAEPDLFFENLGGGRFHEASEARGLRAAAPGYGFAVLATDYDDDGFPDLFVANDSTPNFLYRNRGDGTFESVGLLAGVAVNAEARAQAGMGADAGDYDGDSRLDFVLTTFAHDHYSLYRSLDGAQFEDASGAGGLRETTLERMGWGVSFLDADLDGRLDVFFANGHIFADIENYPELQETYAQRNQLLLNRDGRFVDVSERAGPGLQVARVSRGLAVGDLDGDGDPDLAVSNMDDSPTLLDNRQATGHRHVAFDIVAPAGNRFAIGARVILEAAGRRQVREVRSGGSFLSQSALRASFGLGAHDGPVDVEVRLGRQRWRFAGLASGRLHRLELDPAAEAPRGAR